MGTIGNVISSVARIYYAPQGTELPRAIFGWPVGWTEIGYTFGGVTMEFSTTMTEFKVDQECAPIIRKIKDSRVSVKTSAAEPTIGNLRQFIPTSELADPEVGVGAVGIGNNPMAEYMLGVEGVGVDGNFRAYLFYNAGPASVGLHLDRGGMNLVEVSWNATGDVDIIEGSPYIPTTPGVDVVKVYTWTASGLATEFNLPAKIVTGSDPLVSINGVIQTPVTGYTVQAYATYTKITFTESPTAGDTVLAWYQIAG